MISKISEYDRPDSYYEEIEMPTVGDYREMLKFKDKGTALYDRRWQHACEVIDAVAEYLGINNNGKHLYSLGLDDHSPIIDKLEEFMDRGGDKVKMKKRLNELESENAILRSLLGK